MTADARKSNEHNLVEISYILLVKSYIIQTRSLYRIKTEHIRIAQGDHFKLPVQETCALITVAADARPKGEIFAHLAKALSKDTKLSYRIYEKGLRRLMDDQPVSKLPPEFKEYSRIRPEPPVNNTSIFLVKTGR